MKVGVYKIILFMACFFAIEAYSFILSTSQNGERIYFPNKGSVQIGYDLDQLAIDSELIDSYLLSFQEILKESTGFQVTFKKGDLSGAFNIITVSDAEILSSTVAGVTEVAFNENKEIISGEIRINLGVNLTNDINAYNYFGNVIGHELGHLFGLDHSTSLYSTMTPHLVSGQSTWEHDDTTGFIASLGKENPFLGKIQGRIVGSVDDLGIFGVNVDLIDFDNLKPYLSTVTDRNGDFIFNNVDKSKKYIIGYGPFPFNENYPDLYKINFKGFCYNRDNYKYSILSSCISSYDDGPKILKMGSSGNLDLGGIGLKCDASSGKALFDYTISGTGEGNIFDGLQRNGHASVYGLIGDSRVIKIPFEYESLEPDNVIRVSLASQILAGNFIVQGSIVNLIQNEEIKLGREKELAVSVGGNTIPSYQGLPDFNYVEFLNLTSGLNSFELQLETKLLDQLIEDDLSFSFSKSSFALNEINEIGNFILHIEVGRYDALGEYVPKDSSFVEIANESFACSSAVNSFSVGGSSGESQAATANNSGGGKSVGGCSAVGGEEKVTPSSIFGGIIEMIFYFFLAIILRCAKDLLKQS